MRLSKNFPLKELIRSETAARENIDNRPNPNQVNNLLFVCQFQLQPTKNEFSIVVVTSGFRCFELNTAIGGSKTSDHMEGKATDFRTPEADLKEVFNWMAENLIFGQLIYEAPPNKEPWIHISLPRCNGKPNQQRLYYDGSSYTPVTGRL
jgi:hypothetical protein